MYLCELFYSDWSIAFYGEGGRYILVIKIRLEIEILSKDIFYKHLLSFIP